MKKEYYYLSLQWTRRGNKIMNFWQPNHSGYTQILDNAGVYDEPYSSAPNDVLSVEKHIIDAMAKRIEGIENESKLDSFNVVPNTGKNRRTLGITKFDLNLDGNDDSYILHFPDDIYEITKTVVHSDKFHIKAKETVDEFWYYDEVVEAKNRNAAIYDRFKCSHHWELADEFIEFKKLVTCTKAKEVVFDRWSDEAKCYPARKQRADICQQIINEISNRSHRMFYYKKEDRTAQIYVSKNGRVKFKDDYTNKEIDLHVPSSKSLPNFSHGGTMEALVKDMRDFIVSGEDSNHNHGYGGLYCPHWGYELDDMKVIQDLAIELGYMKPLEEDKAA